MDAFILNFQESATPNRISNESSGAQLSNLGTLNVQTLTETREGGDAYESFASYLTFPR
jgi:hypothetical protein